MRNFYTRNSHKHVFLTTVASLAMLALASPALAQDATADDADAAADGNAEIIVTAQKREERLQDVPVALSVISGDAIAASGGVNIENAQYLVPSLNFRKSGTSLNQALFLRGVGTINFSIAAEPSVAAVLDGVVLSRAGEGFGDLFDVERIEVLRGPQGTLFGKNASAGVVSIVTKRPTNDFGATLEASYYDAKEYRGRATVNIPLMDNIRSRLGVFYSSYDGNITNIALGNRKVNGYKHYGLRAVVEADAGENVMFTLRGDWRKADDDCCAELIGTTPSNAAALALTGTNISGEDTRRINQNLVTATKETSWGLSAQADVDLDGVSITSITSFRKWDNDEIRDGDWLDRPYVGLTQLHDRGPQVSNTFSQELRLASQGSNTIDYVAGLYYSRAYSQRIFARTVINCSASTLAPVVPGLTPCSTAPGASTFTTPSGATNYGSVFKNMSAFGQATWNISDAFRLIAGLRYTADQLNVNLIRRTSLAGPGIQPNFDAGVFNNGQLNANGIGFLAGPSNGVPFRAKTTNDNWSGKVAAQFDLSDDNIAYASFTRGYKGPAYNMFFNLTSVGAGVIAPETVNAYELGLKNTFLDGDLIFNIAAYYAKYKNYQANNPDIVAGQVVSRLTNAGAVSTRGVELDLLYRPSRAFTLAGGLAYTDAKVDQFRLPPGGNPANLIASGTPLANAPKWKASLNADYELSLGASLDLELGAGVAYQSSQLYQLDPNPVVRAATTVPAYSIVDLRAGVASSDDMWKLTFQVKNAFDKSFASSIVSGGPGGSYRYIIPREADRYFGATLLVKFGDEK